MSVSLPLCLFIFPPFLVFVSVLLMQKYLSHFTTSNNLFYFKNVLCALEVLKVRRKEMNFGVSHACIMFPIIFPLSLSICLLDDMKQRKSFFHSIPQERFSRKTPGFHRRTNLSSEVSHF